MPAEEQAMSTTIDEHQEPPKLDELEQLRAQEAGLEQRTSRLEISNPLALIVGFAALAIAIGALVVAIGDRTDMNAQNATSASGLNAPAAATTGAGATSGMNSGMRMVGAHGKFTAAQVAAGGRGTVYVQLGDYWAQPAVPSIRAGKVSFIAKNVGQIPHELMIERAPIKMTSMGKPDEDAAQDMIDDMLTGQTGRMTVRLKPGRYVLFCNAPGHYAAGQHIAFTVTKS
jgi:uncharacterized cupredoxin-like copper-binding protein